MKKWKRALVAPVVVLAVVLTGCADGDEIATNYENTFPPLVRICEAKQDHDRIAELEAIRDYLVAVREFNESEDKITPFESEDETLQRLLEPHENPRAAASYLCPEQFPNLGRG